jgi:hypothetical protein
MENPPCPPSKFQRLERVIITNARLGEGWFGQRGTVIWTDRPYFDRRVRQWAEWGYCVHLPALNCYPSFQESDLTSTGEFDSEESHLGTGYEISFDTVLNDDMGNLESCYRVPGHHWQVFFFENNEATEPKYHFGTWQSGITGIMFDVPQGTPINEKYVMKAMAEVFGPQEWKVVRGPDSLILK